MLMSSTGVPVGIIELTRTVVGTGLVTSLLALDDQWVPGDL